MALPRWCSAPGVSAFINVCANLIQNYALFHNHAMNQSVVVTPSDLPPPEEKSEYDALSAISLTIPRGKAVAMPSIRISEEEDKAVARGQYGGKGDKPHLGGFTEFDPLGVSPTLWKHLIEFLGIKSMVDVGCGRGISTAWFVTHGLEFVQCVEGSHDAVMQSIVPDAEKRVVEHDFSRGPWWPDRTVDLAWAVEFTEHVGRNYQPNYITAFRKAAIVIVTHSNWGGWHHVEVHDDDWWRVRWEAAGFVYTEYLTKAFRAIAMTDQSRKDLTADMKEDHLYFVAQHIYLNAQVFINPMVASLPEHAHLFAEHGCFGGKDGNKKPIHVDCADAAAKGEILTPLPESFKPLKITDEMDQAWLDLIKDFTTHGRPK